MTFRKGHKNMHDVVAAGRKGKANSPWRHRMLHTPNARRVQAEFERRQRNSAQPETVHASSKPSKQVERKQWD